MRTCAALACARAFGMCINARVVHAAHVLAHKQLPRRSRDVYVSGGAEPSRAHMPMSETRIDVCTAVRIPCHRLADTLMSTPAPPSQRPEKNSSHKRGTREWLRPAVVRA
uniref:Uncharacterized protein n=1 Tax=Calcidiscus leptoporus TaxID=127549 RepID=A0A7S0IYL5_9EUKA|mmetsp:Transcript_30174/g.70302  ORF Transcript_30174/g.70302 Transcript_30174/m.70302 type:complete len:110 (+) Transcript_30174:544-873(+)